MYGVTKKYFILCRGSFFVKCGYKVERERGNAVLKARTSKAVTVHNVLQGYGTK